MATRRLAGLLRLPHDGIALNEAFGGEGAIIYKHACLSHRALSYRPFGLSSHPSLSHSFGQ